MKKIKFFEWLSKWFRESPHSRTITHFAAICAVSAVFVGMTVFGVFSTPPTQLPPAEYLKLDTRMKSEELEQKLRTSPSEIQEIIFFKNTKIVAVLEGGFEQEKLVAQVDVDEIRARATAGKVAVREVNSVPVHLGADSTLMNLVWYGMLVGIIIWLCFFLFKKPDEDVSCRFKQFYTKVFEKQDAFLAKKRIRKSKLHLYVWFGMLALAVLLFASRIVLNEPVKELPSNYNSVTRSTAWQVDRHLSRSPADFQRAAVIDELNSLYIVITPPRAVPAQGQSVKTQPQPMRGRVPPQETVDPDTTMMVNPEMGFYAAPDVVPSPAAVEQGMAIGRIVNFGEGGKGKAELDAFVAKLAAMGVPVKHIDATLNTNVFSTMKPLWVAVFLTFFVFLTVHGIVILNRRNAWLEAEGVKQYKGMVTAGGGGNTRSSIGDLVQIAPEDKKTLDDVAGCDEAVAKFRLVAGWLRDAAVFEHFRAKLPKGVLLSGPPGTGKSLLARALAGETEGTYFYASGSEFINKYVGVGADNVRKLFENAKKAYKKTGKPSIIFIDEIDAVGKHRSADGSGGDSERDQTVNQLLTCIQGFDPNNGTLVIAATNRPDTLDSGLTRSGRFDYKIEVGRPDRKGRKAIFGVYLKKHELEPGIKLEELCDELSKRARDMVGADIELVVNNAAVIAATRNAPAFAGKTPEEIAEMPRIITRGDLHQGLDKVAFGDPLTSKVRSDEERELTSIHEIGHAMVPTEENGDPVTRVTIEMTTKSLGLMESGPEEDRHAWSKQQFLTRIRCMLAGRAAEDVLRGSISTGASNDFERASQLARCMAAIYGMSEELGPISFPVDKYGFPTSNIGADLQSEFNRVWRKTIKDCDEQVRAMVRKNRDKIERAAKLLLEEDVLTGDEFRENWNLPLEGEQFALFAA